MILSQRRAVGLDGMKRLHMKYNAAPILGIYFAGACAPLKLTDGHSVMRDWRGCCNGLIKPELWTEKKLHLVRMSVVMVCLTMSHFNCNYVLITAIDTGSDWILSRY